MRREAERNWYRERLENRKKREKRKDFRSHCEPPLDIVAIASPSIYVAHLSLCIISRPFFLSLHIFMMESQMSPSESHADGFSVSLLPVDVNNSAPAEVTTYQFMKFE